MRKFDSSHGAKRLFIAQCVNRVEAGGAVGGVEAEEDADAQGDGQGQDDTLRRDEGAATPQQGCDDLGAAHTEQYADDPSCTCLLYTSPSPRDRTRSRMPSSA